MVAMEEVAGGVGPAYWTLRTTVALWEMHQGEVGVLYFRLSLTLVTTPKLTPRTPPATPEPAFLAPELWACSVCRPACPPVLSRLTSPGHSETPDHDGACFSLLSLHPTARPSTWFRTGRKKILGAGGQRANRTPKAPALRALVAAGAWLALVASAWSPVSRVPCASAHTARPAEPAGFARRAEARPRPLCRRQSLSA